MKTNLILSGIVALLFFVAVPAYAATLYSQTITLQTGWNIVSTPKVLDSHSFSTAENSTNFDIYALDSSKPSGWATLADLGQSEFTPLYGYFINNKTGIVQTLVFNYKSDTAPNQRLFERVFSATGWYSFGVANSSYALPVNSATTTDSNNPSDMLSALIVSNSMYDSVVDFTHASSTTNINSVAVTDPWKLVVQSAVNTINDFRETKGYAIYIKQADALYTGVQDNLVPPIAECSDGLDNDGDNFIDYPADIACTSLLDNDESPSNLPGALVVGLLASPASQAVTPGSASVLMANFSFDASQSGEDLRLSSVPARLTFATGAATELTGCQIFDGATALNTGSNVVNPSGTSPADNTFTLDNPVTITKGTVKTLGVKCNVSGSATDTATFAWSPGAAAFITNFSVTGAASGTTITATNGVGTAPTFTIGTGSMTVATDASNPSYKLASANTTGSTNLVAKFRATNEDVTLTKVGLQLSNTASSSASDLVKVTLWDGATKVGEAFFLGGQTVATSTLTTPIALTKNTDKALTVKADYSTIGIGEPVTFSGHLVAIDIVDAEGVGAQSGTTIVTTYATPNTALTASNGTRVFKSFPTFALDSTVNGTTGLADGKLMRFKVTADAAGAVGITQFAVNVATSTASLSNITIYGFEDSGYSTPISGVTSSGDLQATDDCASGCSTASPNLTIGVTTSGGTATAIQVPAGSTRYFEVRASVSGSATGASVTTKILGSSSFPATSAGISSNPLVTAGSGSFAATDFVWSPNSTATAARADTDWTNGYGVTGLPAGGLITTRSH